MKVVTITGYKPFELGIFRPNDPAITIIKLALEKEIRSLIDEGVEWFLISGQLGIECWAAEVVYELQEEFPEVKLAVLTPFLNQEERWNEGNKELYEMILAQADFVSAISNTPYKTPKQFHNKNRIFLHKTDGVLIIYDEEKPGSPQYFLKEARKYKEKYSYLIRMITFYDLQLIVEEEQLRRQEES
ncbi:putative phage-like protein YoqJ [Oikeobacillus pervagus]|uniref:UPF0398 protein J2S13_000040 n=1 Tax=Oikeobacillus pervagus TaxID=1325931 RepID=A0AAJ1WJ06_9BACI|nr:DUF1273 domain-containing protein [Oikeobacillus pervagus]MDQ0213646.1 putative phage-like protein YoqJ [Oikeobacillus pervagus]